MEAANAASSTEGIRQELAVNPCRVLWILARNIFSLISTVSPFTWSRHWWPRVLVMENNDQQPPPPPAAGALPPAIGQQIKLPSFWPEDPASWFRLAECQFALRNVADPVTRYYHVLAALSVDSVRLVRHVLHDDTGPKSYNRLLASLLASHSPPTTRRWRGWCGCLPSVTASRRLCWRRCSSFVGTTTFLKPKCSTFFRW